MTADQVLDQLDHASNDWRVSRDAVRATPPEPDLEPERTRFLTSEER